MDGVQPYDVIINWRPEGQGQCDQAIAKVMARDAASAITYALRPAVLASLHIPLNADIRSASL